MASKFLDDKKDKFYLIFRLIIGLMFFLHGAMKFGILDGSFSVPGNVMILIAGIIEVVAGIIIFWGGSYTRKAAAVSAIVMLYAFVVVHVFGGDSFNLNPLSNGGELALIYLVAFMVIATTGAGKLWNHEK